MHPYRIKTIASTGHQCHSNVGRASPWHAWITILSCLIICIYMYVSRNSHLHTYNEYIYTCINTYIPIHIHKQTDIYICVCVLYYVFVYSTYLYIFIIFIIFIFKCAKFTIYSFYILLLKKICPKILKIHLTIIIYRLKKNS